MVKLNNGLFGNFRGKLGNQYFVIKKGVTGKYMTVGAQINSSPANPKSHAQMQQRAMFANSIKFYQRATSNFFRFAFQDRKPNESDYNAFVRHNVSNSLFLSRQRVNSSLFPALGSNWQLSEGTLSSCFSGETTPYSSGAGFVLASTDNNTVASYSRYLIDMFGFRPGDIVTFVFVYSPVNASNVGSLASALDPPAWTVMQFIVDTSDDTVLTDISQLSQNTSYVPEIGVQGSSLVVAYDGAGSSWFGVVHTRIENNKLLANTTFLYPSTIASTLINSMRRASVINEAMESWQANESALLSGTLANGTMEVTGDGVQTVNGATVPYRNDTLSFGATVTWPLTGTNLTQYSAADFRVANGRVISYSASSDTAATISFTLAEFIGEGYGRWQLIQGSTTLAYGTVFGV